MSEPAQAALRIAPAETPEEIGAGGLIWNS